MWLLLKSHTKQLGGMVTDTLVRETPNKGKKYPAQTLTPGEVQALLDGCSMRAPTGIRNRAMLLLMYRSGLRVAEVMALRPSDVNLAKHSIRVLHGKGDKATTRGFHPSVTDALARWIDTRKELGLKGPLFCTLDGGKIHEQYARNLIKRLGAKAGIEKRVHPHGLRHTYAVELEEAGLPVTKISKLLGHSSVSVTSRYLDHLTNDQAVSALDDIDLPEIR
jgi:site-specific recombinase XerD